MREKLVELLSGFSIDTAEAVEFVADHLITNGVTIPVRCKDCKHQNEDGDCDIHDDWFTRKPDSFCSYGERRTDEI